ncbi:Hydroxymethylglutaryl-CoA synthase [Plasmodiophora brassicae]|uniref:Hydroxymethylglutaryl-CoA synthase n=1 Tax=Plasmodiophora brassicae TaxID=37360 RepID=A0A0G4IVV1_PLABS|nr:hypothetical protein PBRA_001097 [Plasmodiophora brassicae]SPQ97204.1 unnamed protein product [Plasmodiophora brassicae]
MTSGRDDESGRARDVGIVAVDVYFPKRYVDQADLERYEGAAAGKFTIGLGQTRMAFVDDREDIYSIALTVTSQLMEKAGVPYSDVGFLQVGTETIIDHSKSVKSVLMQLFGDNTDVEGVDSVHACYGGTNALFNAVAWMQSDVWDGRYALVVAADIAEYAAGPARPTGGVGAVAMLIGPNAPIVLEPCRATHMEHAYDFYKPNLMSPHPVVDGHLSNMCYLKSLDQCYQRYVRKSPLGSFSVVGGDADYAVFHAPYNKLVQKSFARLLFNDFLRDPENDLFDGVRGVASDIPLEASYDSKPLNDAFSKGMKHLYNEKAEPATLLPKLVGNMYTASLYAGLVSLLSTQPSSQLAGKRILMFSYGSGLAASMFSFRVASDAASVSALDRIRGYVNLERRIAACQQVVPDVMVKALERRVEVHGMSSFVPTGSLGDLVDGAFYLTEKDKRCRRFHQRLTRKPAV